MPRYIDADVARRIIDSPRSKEQMLLVLSQAEPADVVKVVHGEWIPSRFKTLREDGWCECSVCGVGNKLYDRGVRKSDVPHIDGKSYELKNIANYCPNCGARMDGEV